MPLSSTAPEERIQVLDALRGFALLGVLVVNMTFYSQPIVAAMVSMMGEGPPGNKLNRVATLLVRVLAEGKFYTLFTLLFGVGMFVQMTRVESQGGAFLRLYARRLAALAAFGVMHALLVWPGDILLPYAVAGFLLLLFRKRQDRILLWSALALLLGPMSYRTVVGFLIPMLHDQLDPTAPLRRTGQLAPLLADAWRAYGQHSFLAVTRQRVRDGLLLLPSSLEMLPGILGMFLIGVRIARRNLLQDPAAHRRLLVRTFALCLPLGLALSTLYALGRVWHTPAGRVCVDVGLNVGGPLLCFAYASGLALLSTRAPRWLAPLSAAGRMPLTNYLSQSLICTTLFYGYGLGLLGRIGRAGGLALAVGLWLVQLRWSTLWLAHFRYGPAEWLWRWLTYGQRPAMRRHPPATPRGAREQRPPAPAPPPA